LDPLDHATISLRMKSPPIQKFDYEPNLTRNLMLLLLMLLYSLLWCDNILQMTNDILHRLQMNIVTARSLAGWLARSFVYDLAEGREEITMRMSNNMNS
jgi:hypothetical protein